MRRTDPLSIYRLQRLCATQIRAIDSHRLTTERPAPYMVDTTELAQVEQTDNLFGLNHFPNNLRHLCRLQVGVLPEQGRIGGLQSV